MTTTGELDLLRFWARRARRLLPNAVVTLLAVLLLTYLLLPAYRRAAISADVVAAALFVSNFRFGAIAIDYFHTGDPPSPVLHFWSLGVEEQFYLGWPILIWLAARFGGRRRNIITAAILTITLALSIGFNLLVIGHNQPADFFSTQGRIWQLATGGLVGIALRRFQQTCPRRFVPAAQLPERSPSPLRCFGSVTHSHIPGFGHWCRP